MKKNNLQSKPKTFSRYANALGRQECFKGLWDKDDERPVDSETLRASGGTSIFMRYSSLLESFKANLKSAISTRYLLIFRFHKMTGLAII